MVSFISPFGSLFVTSSTIPPLGALAGAIAMKKGRRLSRGRGIGYVSIQICALITATPARTALPTAHFDRNESHVLFMGQDTNVRLFGRLD